MDGLRLFGWLALSARTDEHCVRVLSTMEANSQPPTLMVMCLRGNMTCLRAMVMDMAGCESVMLNSRG